MTIELKLRTLSAILLCAMLAGCIPGQPPPPRVQPDAPVFMEREISRHLSRLKRDLSDDPLPYDHRQSFERYVAARMAEFGLQPAYGPTHLAPYYRPELYPRFLTARAARVGGGEVEVPGLSSGPRSAAGTVSFREVWFNPGPLTELDGDVVVVAGEETTSDILERLHDAGARAVFIVGSAPRPILGGPFADLLVINASRSSAANALGLTSSDLAERLRAGRQRREMIPNRVVVEVAIDQSESRPLVNVLGLVAGKVPTPSRELVIIGAEYDGRSADSNQRSMLPKNGAAVAAVLELARHYGKHAPFGPFPERTVLFALWSGADLNHLGARAYLESPVWPVSEVTDVILLASPDAADRLRDLWESRGYRVTIVPRLETSGTNGRETYAATETAEALRLAGQASEILYKYAGSDQATASANSP